ncbi:MAG: hypothetical protein COW84_02280 [Gammaproteobacteria bacterium CG22_combo_CG10-13_8_21_14_all_40_8]|nr:MAG: hypothetical protein COW84_02280 [Gammaproteobacteria bacterium CG22_combo_CG10-13_8_21_14_all_40_8]
MSESIFSQKRILIVEDDFANQKVATLFFKKLGCLTDIAENGFQAVKKASDNVYDLIIMDCQMPLMDGMEATEKIRENIGQEIPIIAMTANIDYKDRQSCFDAGMNDFVTKPINLQILTDVLEKWLTTNPID